MNSQQNSKVKYSNSVLLKFGEFFYTDISNNTEIHLMGLIRRSISNHKYSDNFNVSITGNKRLLIMMYYFSLALADDKYYHYTIRIGTIKNKRHNYTYLKIGKYLSYDVHTNKLSRSLHIFKIKGNLNQKKFSIISQKFINLFLNVANTDIEV